MKKVLVPIANGSEEFEAIGIIDTLRRADIEVLVASVNEIQITASQNTKIVADVLIETCADDEFDLIVLPGGLSGARNLRNNKILTQNRQIHRLTYLTYVFELALKIFFIGKNANRIGSAFLINLRNYDGVEVFANNPGRRRGLFDLCNNI